VPEKLRLNGEISVGTVIHIIVLVVTISVAWGKFDERAALLEQKLEDVTKQQAALALQLTEESQRTEQVERYLIGRDRTYPDGGKGH
jgi:hypothetical protein